MVIGEKNKIVIIGDGETAELAYEYFKFDSQHDPIAFSVNKQFIKKKSLFDLPIVPFEEIEKIYDPKNYKAFVAISFANLNRLRTRLYRQVKAKGFSLVSYISSKSFIWSSVEIGENCFILENNMVQRGAKIGNNVILWSGNQINHKAEIKDNCFLSSHVVLSGSCKIDKNCFLGANSCVAPNIKVACDCIIGAGAVVIRDTQMGKIYVGNPARALSNKTSFECVNL